MPEIRNRRKKEREFAAAIAQLQGKHKREVIRLLGSSPSLSDIGPEFWNRASNELRDVLRPFVLELAIDGAQDFSRQAEAFGVGVDWGLVNAEAVEFASQYSVQTAAAVTDTTRRNVGKLIARSFETSMTRQELVDALAPTFGPSRAQMIAVTETTRAAAEGRVMVQADLRRQGVETYSIWETRDDEKVCPICGPLDGKDVTQSGLRPPAHVNCRCFLTLSIEQGPEFEVEL